MKKKRSYMSQLILSSYHIDNDDVVVRCREQSRHAYILNYKRKKKKNAMNKQKQKFLSFVYIYIYMLSHHRYIQ